MEEVVEQFKETILAAGRQRQALCIRGGGTKDWYGQTPRGDILDTRAYSGVVEYDPTELVITVRAGTPLAEVEEVLAQQNEALAFDPPHFGPGATIGGMVACGCPARVVWQSVRRAILCWAPC